MSRAECLLCAEWIRQIVLAGKLFTDDTHVRIHYTVIEIATAPTFKPFRTYASQLDTMKLYTRAHGSKTTNLIINLDHPEWVLEGEQKSKTLQEVGCENETELSFFNRSEYEAFLENPETTW